MDPQRRQYDASSTMQRSQSSSRTRAYARAEETGPRTVRRYDCHWVRSSLRGLDFLRSTRSIDTAAGSVIELAIRWAPFGGASSGDLLVTFGVARHRFVEMLDDALRPRRTDNQEVRHLKGTLLAALAAAWHIDRAPKASSARR